MTELRFLVGGISCRHCADAVMTALDSVPGVETVQIDLATRWAVVRGPALDVERIRAATAESGHQADL